jgi:hypothetical protein
MKCGTLQPEGVIAQAFWCWFDSRVSSCKISSEQSGTGARFSLSSFGFSQLITIQPLLRIYASQLSEVRDGSDHATHHNLGL